MIFVLAESVRVGRSISEFVAELPPRFTHSDRIKNIETEKSKVILAHILNDVPFRKELFSAKGAVCDLDTLDGVRMKFDDGDIVHLRAFGNASELRCYTESVSYGLAKALCETTLERVV